MIPEEALRIVIVELEKSGIPYMITGSFASSIHGVPRATQDADVVIEADAASLHKLVGGLGEQFYVDEEAAQEALASYQMFNVIHYETGFKVDLIVRKPRPFSQEEFGRRQQFTFLGRPCWFATAEDTILAKLEWAQRGSPERQFRDVAGVARIQGEELDRSYLRKWAKQLGVSQLLERLFQELGEGK